MVVLVEVVSLAAGDTQLCAGNGVQDTCQGDSGGPLLSSVLGASSTVTEVGKVP